MNNIIVEMFSAGLARCAVLPCDHGLKYYNFASFRAIDLISKHRVQTRRKFSARLWMQADAERPAKRKQIDRRSAIS